MRRRCWVDEANPACELFDNCNSLHTNAYDEVITAPTEECVRRAVAIRMAISKELGLNVNENPWQSFPWAGTRRLFAYRAAGQRRAGMRGRKIHASAC
jgi:hypothetical protein